MLKSNRNKSDRTYTTSTTDIKMTVGEKSGDVTKVRVYYESGHEDFERQAQGALDLVNNQDVVMNNKKVFQDMEQRNMNLIDDGRLNTLKNDYLDKEANAIDALKRQYLNKTNNVIDNLKAEHLANEAKTMKEIAADMKEREGQ